MKSYQITVAEHIGKVRRNNEDNFYVDGLGISTGNNAVHKIWLSQKNAVFAVCDGMGGENFGKEASWLAVSILAQFSPKLNQADSDQLTNIVNQYVKETNYQICHMAEEHCCKCSGSTLALVCLHDGVCNIFNLGDSRVYYYQDAVLKQITEDQTVAIRKLKMGIYTEEQAQNSPEKNQLTYFLGADTREIGVKPLYYDSLLLDTGKIIICSDGITDMCTNQEIAEIISTATFNPAEGLMQRALKNGGKDNITCVVIENYV